MVALTHNAGTYAYQVSKAACEHFTKAVANDVGKYGIRVNSVLPGMFPLLCRVGLVFFPFFSFFFLFSKFGGYEYNKLTLGNHSNECSTFTGSTLTPMTKVFFGDIPEGKFEETMEAYGLPATPLQPEDVARVIVWLLSENSLDVNGIGLPVGGSEP